MTRWDGDGGPQAVGSDAIPNVAGIGDSEAFDRASLVRRTSLQQRIFVALAAYATGMPSSKKNPPDGLAGHPTQ